MYDINKIVKKVSDMLSIFLDDKKATHSEILKCSKDFLKKVAPDLLSSPQEYTSVLNKIVNSYEINVGLKIYDPTIIAADNNKDLWLYKIKDKVVAHPFMHRYKMYLSRCGYEIKTIANIENISERILAYCANPASKDNHVLKRGLVVGDVQSGKTANYLGLINTAFDYGYKIAILLAGTTDSLRIQTQKRTDQGVIGAKSDTIGNIIEYCGVGENDKNHFAIPFTNQSNDFAKFIQRNFNATIADIKKPVILVIKKNATILETVIERLKSALKDHDSRTLLVIDDEADNSSVNTARSDRDPTKINYLIRRIINNFPIASYVGFTATPFANIFINPEDKDPENSDLFPADFIVQLHAPSSYCGCEKIFPDSDQLSKYIRLISELEPNFLPVKHKKDDDYEELCDSLKEAIQSFLINNVIRTIRGDEFKHRSMMINISRFNAMQERIWEKVNGYIEKLRNIVEQESDRSTTQFIKNEDMKNMYDLFMNDPFYQNITDLDGTIVSWNNIQAGLYNEIKQIKVVMVNSRNGKMSQRDLNGKKERFDYEDYSETGARVISIGGLVLSRGLTLEGLMVSYYSRNAGAYDTLLQMGRWFGYRKGYEDLCRIYITQTNIDRFSAVRDAVNDLKIQIAEMNRKGKTPKDFGLMVRESPDTLETSLLVTSRNKMRDTDVYEYHLNYGGVYADTSKLLRDAATNKHNLTAFKKFYAQLDFAWNHNYFMANHVSKYLLADFLRELKIPYINKKFDTESLSNYIENSDLFREWDVVIAKGESQKFLKFMDVEGLSAVVRSFHTGGDDDRYIRIGGSNNRVLDPNILNCGLWLSKAEEKKILVEKNKLLGENYTSLTALDYLKKRENPILVVYPIDLKVELSAHEKQSDNNSLLLGQKKKIKQNLGNHPLIAFAVAFPAKESKVMVNYRMNKVKIEEFLANTEVEEDVDEDD